MKRLIPLLLLSATIAFGAENAPRPSLVVTAPLTRGTVNPLQNFVGTLYYEKQSRLASETEGVVRSMHFREGQQLAKGDTLLRLDSRILQANISAASSALRAQEAELQRQERELERSKALFERSSISQSSFDRVYYAALQLKEEVASMRSSLEALQIQLEKSSIKAPFDAVVSARNAEVGEWVGKGTPVATLIDMQSIEARVSVPAALIDSLRSNTRFAATVEGHDFDVTLKGIIPVADAASRTFGVRLEVPKNMGFIEGMRIDVKIPTLNEQSSLLVPRDALIKRFGNTVVFANVDGKAVMLPVQVVGYNSGMAAIEAQGLEEQMRIVVKGNERIFPNMPLVEKGQ